jgi:hypothetical protein
MGVPTSEVSYTSAMPRREDHEVHKGHVVALDQNNITYITQHVILKCNDEEYYFYVYVFVLYVYVSSSCQLALFDYPECDFSVLFSQL